MQLREIEYIIAVSEAKSLTVAAKRLHISQPALSQSIKKLEQELGVELFRRESRLVLLTSAGEVVVEEGRRMLDIRDDIQKKLTDLSENKSGKLKVGVTPLYGQVFFSKIYLEFRKRHPNIELQLFEAQGEDQEHMLLNGKIDVGLFASPSYCRALQYEPIYYERMVLVMSTDDALNRFGYVDPSTGMPFIDLKQMQDADFLGFTRERSNLAGRVDAICLEHGFQPRVVFKSKLSTVLRSLVSSGLGISLISWMAMYGIPLMATDNPVNYYNITGKEAERSYWCAFQREGYCSSIMKSFIETCHVVHEKMVNEDPIMRFFLASRSIDWTAFEQQNDSKR